MLTGVENYYKPKSIQEALELATGSQKNVFLGGGSILALSNSPGIEGLIDLSSLDLGKIKEREDCLVLGAGCTIRQIQKAEESGKYFSGILAETAGNYLTALLRNQAQLGGILAAAFNADIVGALLALNASVHFQTLGGEKVFPLDVIYEKNPYAYFEHAIAVKITIPMQGQRTAYRRIAKTATDTSIISVFACKTEDSCRVVINAGVYLPTTEKELKFENIESYADRLDTFSDVRGSAQYRKEMAKVLLKRVISELEG